MSSNTVERGREAALPPDDNRLAERYRRIMERWTPVGMEYFEEWSERPNCGHFLGGCHWYGIETIAGSLSFAALAASPRYDEEATGYSRRELREIALKGLRYLCFTHDTGPDGCVRPDEGLGRSENSGTKWGERGKGFFRESQCGSTVAGMAITAMLLGDLVDEETWSMLREIHEDYAERFGEMQPKSGIYWDTQMEENAWTSYGLASVELFLANDPSVETWTETARRWMFSTAAAPQDSKNQTGISDEDQVSDLTNRTYTTLPDYMAENHGMVHPSYTASSINFTGRLACIYGVFDAELPPHALHNRQEIYDQLKRMTDSSGSLHPVQGMDWSYLPPDPGTGTHAAAALTLDDSDAAYFERRALETFENRQAGNDGYLYDPETVDTLHDVQDPVIMREANIVNAAYGYLLHRLYGEGPAPTPEEEIRERLTGVKTYPHSGFVFHRHDRGQTSFAWRNCIMALPLNSDGLYTVAPASESVLGRVEIEDRGDSQDLISVQIDEREDAFAAAVSMKRNEGAVRQDVLHASLPHGPSLSWERLTAREEVTIEKLDQGFLRIINEDFPSLDGNCRGERTLYTPAGSRDFPGFVSDDPADDIVTTYDHPAWLNIDDRFGIVRRGGGTTVYHNRHHFDPWWAVADDLTLSHHEVPLEAAPQETLGTLAALVVPDQPHEETASQELTVLTAPNDVVGLLTDGHLAVANFGQEARTPTFTTGRSGSDPVPIPAGETELRDEQVRYRLSLEPGAAGLYRPQLGLEADGSVDVVAVESGAVTIRNVDEGAVTVRTDRSSDPIRLAVDETVTL